MTHAEHVPAGNTWVIARRLDAAAWGLSFVWLGIALIGSVGGARAYSVWVSSRAGISAGWRDPVGQRRRGLEGLQTDAHCVRQRHVLKPVLDHGRRMRLA